MYDVVIIGSGPAGLTAAIYTGRAGLKTLVLEAFTIGGNAALTDLIDNYPGYPFGINGYDLMEKFRQQAERFGTEISMEEVLAIKDAAEGKKVVVTDQNEYLTRAVIIAAGVKRRQLEVPGEEDFAGRGVSYCATCDGAFFNQAAVAVVGGGETALKEALYLSDIASRVYLIHRRDQFRASPTSIDKVMSRDNIELKLNRVVDRVEGDAMMTGLVLTDVKSGAKERLAVEGLFVSIGMVATAEFVQGTLDHQDGYIITDEKLLTSKEGIFAAGDIRVKNARQVATAVGDGALAGIAVTEFLKE